MRGWEVGSSGGDYILGALSWYSFFEGALEAAWIRRVSGVRRLTSMTFEPLTSSPLSVWFG